MTYPQHGDASGPDSGSGFTDYTAQSPYMSPSSGQPDSGQMPYAESTYGQQGFRQDVYGAMASPSGLSTTDPQTGPPSNIGWAVASILFFWPLSFVAMTRALQVYPLWAAGRHAEAEAASATAKKLGLISIAVVAVLIVLYFVFIFVMVGVAATAGY